MAHVDPLRQNADGKLGAAGLGRGLPDQGAAIGRAEWPVADVRGCSSTDTQPANRAISPATSDRVTLESLWVALTDVSPARSKTR
jgi:hypothetical protein